MKIAAGSDHAGLDLKNALVKHLREQGHAVDDLGTFERASTDYPDRARAVAQAVASGAAERGLLCCGTGQGMAMTANRVHGIRAAVLSDVFSAKATRAHNDANVLCLGQRVVGEGLAAELVDAFFATAFEGGRHAARVAKIEGPSS
jgi:ribose 5-phosphate isomerase B